MVPVKVAEKVSAVIEAKTAEIWVVPEPEASAKRPVPPVIVKEAAIWITPGLEVGQMTSLAEMKTSSPFAAVRVSCSVPVNPPHSERPVRVPVPANIVFPRCSRWPVPARATVVCDVAVTLPERLPLKGLEWEANATGNAPSIARTASMVGIRISLFILF